MARYRLALRLPRILAGLCAVAVAPHFVEALLKLGDAFLGESQLVCRQHIGLRVLLRLVARLTVPAERSGSVTGNTRASSAPSMCQTSLLSLVPVRAPPQPIGYLYDTPVHTGQRGCLGKCEHGGAFSWALLVTARVGSDG